MNLVTNASESYEGSPGQVSVELTEVYFDSEDEAESYQIGSVSRGKYHCITITDAGCGMAPETSARIFEPFFSTKDSGHGLGLAAVSGIITGHQGALSVQTQVGGGTKVSVLLPAAKGVAAMAMIANTQVSLTGKRILVIDDESMIRQVVKRALSREGVRVTTARDGQEGLKVFQEAPDDFDVLLVDLTMPGLDGKQVMTAARQLRPACRIVLSSGYNQGDSSVLLKERIRFLPKPYTAPELIAVLQSALEETNERTDFS